MQVVSINDKLPSVVMEEEQKQNMLNVIDYMRKMIEDGEIKEFVAASIDDDGICQIHVSAMDLPGSIGLFEIGKHLLISQESMID
jgi:hypothetical protein